MDFSSSFKILVKVNRPNTEIIGFDKTKNAYIMDVNAQARAGKANIEIIRYFKKKYKKDIRIVSGFKNREKIIKILT